MKIILYIAVSFTILNATAQNIGIGTTTPLEKLEVVGGIKIGTTIGTNAGTIRWDNNHLQVYTGSAWKNLDYNWSLTGNSGTVDGTNFIGTTDNIPFNIRVNNQKAGSIDHIRNQ